MASQTATKAVTQCRVLTAPLLPYCGFGSGGDQPANPAPTSGGRLASSAGKRLLFLATVACAVFGGVGLAGDIAHHLHGDGDHKMCNASLALKECEAAGCVYHLHGHDHHSLAKGTTQPATACDDWSLHLTDDYGDGWHGATLSVSDCDGTVLEGGLSMSGSVEQLDVCLPASSGYTITVGGGSWDSEISWSLLDDSGAAVMSGAAGEVTTCGARAPTAAGPPPAGAAGVCKAPDHEHEDKDSSDGHGEDSDGGNHQGGQHHGGNPPPQQQGGNPQGGNPPSQQQEGNPQGNERNAEAHGHNMAQGGEDKGAGKIKGGKREVWHLIVHSVSLLLGLLMLVALRRELGTVMCDFKTFFCGSGKDTATATTGEASLEQIELRDVAECENHGKDAAYTQSIV